MELLKEIMARIIEKEEINITFTNMKISANEIIEMECYKTLQKIHDVIKDDNLSDFECIEKIVFIFEEVESNGGNRHDFG